MSARTVIQSRPDTRRALDDRLEALWRRASITATTTLTPVTTDCPHTHQLCLPSVARLIAIPTVAIMTGVTAVNTITSRRASSAVTDLHPARRKQ